MIIIGWILVPIAATFKAYKKVHEPDGWGVPKDKYHFTWMLLWPWDNWEDGIADISLDQEDSLWWRIVYWSCIRNPVNNLRLVPFLSVKIKPEKVNWVGSYGNGNFINTPAETRSYDTKTKQWFFCWHGFYSNFYWQFNLFGQLMRFWIGWKILPKDVYGVEPYRKSGAGFAMQFKRVR
jgi:hypothetical protein